MIHKRIGVHGDNGKEVRDIKFRDRRVYISGIGCFLIMVILLITLVFKIVHYRQ